jgi:hypothetical protein
LFVINELRNGEKLTLKVEPSNIHNENAVEIYCNNKKLEYIPKNANYSIVKILNAGWDIFECYVQKIDRDELIIQVAVFVRERG